MNHPHQTPFDLLTAWGLFFVASISLANAAFIATILAGLSAAAVSLLTFYLKVKHEREGQ